MERIHLHHPAWGWHSSWGAGTGPSPAMGTSRVPAGQGREDAFLGSPPGQLVPVVCTQAHHSCFPLPPNVTQKRVPLLLCACLFTPGTLRQKYNPIQQQKCIFYYTLCCAQHQQQPRAQLPVQLCDRYPCRNHSPIASRDEGASRRKSSSMAQSLASFPL